MKNTIYLTFIYSLILFQFSWSQTYVVNYQYFSQEMDGDLEIIEKNWSTRKEKDRKPNTKLVYRDGISLFTSTADMYTENKTSDKISTNTVLINPVYKDQKENNQTVDYSKFSAALGSSDDIVVSSPLEPYKWKLDNSQKRIIAGYNCKVATTVIAPGMQLAAWYTDEIPINDGPSFYWGLPGLILQLQSGNDILIIATDIKEEKKNRVIRKPKGKSLTEEEFNTFVNDALRPQAYTRPDGTRISRSGEKN